MQHFISYKKLPIRKKEENISIYIGRVLGYQYPVNLRKNKPRFFVEYLATHPEYETGKNSFFVEGIRFKSHYKSNKAKFSKALKPYGYTVEEVIRKNPSYKN